MKYIVVALVVLAALAVVSADASHFDFLKNVNNVDGTPRKAPQQQQPTIRAGGFCRDRFVPWECPIYDYVPDLGLEFRYYPGPVTFVTSTARGPPGNLLEGFELTGGEIERYFNGSNASKRRIFPGMPVQISVEGANIVNTFYTTWFVFPRNESIPAPDSRYIRILTVPEGSGFVMVTQNFAPTPLMEAGNDNAERIIFGAAFGLWEFTEFLGIPIYQDIFWFNDFQPPFVHQNRRHENWFEINQAANRTTSLSSLLRTGRTEENIMKM